MSLLYRNKKNSIGGKKTMVTLSLEKQASHIDVHIPGDIHMDLREKTGV